MEGLRLIYFLFIEKIGEDASKVLTPSPSWFLGCVFLVEFLLDGRDDFAFVHRVGDLNLVLFSHRHQLEAAHVVQFALALGLAHVAEMVKRRT